MEFPLNKILLKRQLTCSFNFTAVEVIMKCINTIFTVFGTEWNANKVFDK